MEAGLAVPPLPWPALAGAPRAAGFAARILGYGHSSSFGIQPRSLRLEWLVMQAVLPLVASMPSAFGRHPGAAAVIPAVVHARHAFGLLYFPGCQPGRSLRCHPHSISLERQLRFRRAWKLFRFGNIHSPGGASCQDCGGFLPPRINSPIQPLALALLRGTVFGSRRLVFVHLLCKAVRHSCTSAQLLYKCRE